jgi:hypothetical protein
MAMRYLTDGEDKKIFINDILKGITARSLNFNLRESDLLQLNRTEYSASEKLLDKLVDLIFRSRRKKKAEWDLLVNYVITLQQDYVSALKSERPKLEAENAFLALPYASLFLLHQS